MNPTKAAGGIQNCSDNPWYCPSTALNYTVTNQGFSDGATANTSFSVGNADQLIANSNDAAVNGLAGEFPGGFDFGLPFFFGRSVFVAMEGKSTPGGSGPYIAY